MLAIVDSGPLYAALDAGDAHHGAARDVLERADLQLVIPALVVAEVSYLVQTRLGSQAERAFLSGLATLDVAGPTPEDLHRMADLVEQYADWPLGATDASVVALAERLDTTTVVTFDRRHFDALRTAAGEALRLLP
jgi:hypothetical protein